MQRMRILIMNLTYAYTFPTVHLHVKVFWLQYCYTVNNSLRVCIFSRLIYGMIIGSIVFNQHEILDFSRNSIEDELADNRIC